MTAITPCHVFSALTCSPPHALQDDDGVLYQIVVFHDDEYVRTYTVSDKEFEVVKDTAGKDQSAAPKFRGAECIIVEDEKPIPEGRLQKVRSGLAAVGAPSGMAEQHITLVQMMKSRPFRGGCKNGKNMIHTKGVANMKDVRIQYWDTTQATWYRGAIRGMWQEKPRTHWLVRFDDDTDYAVGKTDDVWKLVCETPNVCFYFSGQ